MATTQSAEKLLRIAISNGNVKKSAVSELIMQRLEAHGAISDASVGKLENVDLLVTTGTEFPAKMVDHPATRSY
jgi:hypothetical protein